jgi:hypothetical protein
MKFGDKWQKGGAFIKSSFEKGTFLDCLAKIA